MEDLPFQFKVEITPGRIVGWTLITSPDLSEGIMCGDVADLRDKIRGVCLVDEFGNLVNYDPKQHKVKPQMLLSWSDPSAEPVVESAEEDDDDNSNGLVAADRNAKDSDAADEEDGAAMDVAEDDTDEGPSKKSSKRKRSSTNAQAKDQRASKVRRGDDGEVDAALKGLKVSDCVVIALQPGLVRRLRTSGAGTTTPAASSSSGAKVKNSEENGGEEEEEIHGFIISEDAPPLLKRPAPTSAWLCARDETSQYKS